MPRLAEHQGRRRPPKSTATSTIRPREGELRERFVVTQARKVSRDNILAQRGQDYEVPRGHADTQVPVYRHLLSGEISLVH